VVSECDFGASVVNSTSLQDGGPGLKRVVRIITGGGRYVILAIVPCLSPDVLG
jgi:hypothetical protein